MTELFREQQSKPGDGLLARRVTVVISAIALILLFRIVWRPISRGMRRNHEGTGFGNLAEIRTALSKYYGDTEGRYPPDLSTLTSSFERGTRLPYLTSIPAAKPGQYHPNSSQVQIMTTDDFLAKKFTDVGGWAYVIGGGTRTNDGQIVINCTHLSEFSGSPYTSY